MPYANSNKLSKNFKEGWVEITNDIYKELLFIHLGMDKNYKGFLNEGGVIVKIERKAKPPPVVNLQDYIIKAKARIDREAGNARLRYITEAPGQTGVYLEKMKQAAMFLENNPTSMEGYEYIIGEAEARNISYTEAAELINNIANLWNRQISPVIEKTRIEAKNQLDLLNEDSDVSSVEDIVNSAIQTLRAI